MANHPATARQISFELAQKFVADNPPQALMDRMAQTFLKTHGDIRAVMKTMLDSQEFWSEGAWQTKVKTPFEMAASAVRATGADVDDVYGLAGQVAKLGEPLYRKLEPTGYSNANAEWVNSAALLSRMNFALALAAEQAAGSPRVDLAARILSTIRRQTAREGSCSPMRRRKPRMPSTKALLIEKARTRSVPTPALVAGLVIGSPGFSASMNLRSPYKREYRSMNRRMRS